MVVNCPLVSVARVHGKAVAQPPVFETKVRPTGVVSETVGEAESGPLLVTVIV